MARQASNSPQNSPEKTEAPSTERSERIDRIRAAMEGLVQKSLGASEGWDDLAGPSKAVELARDGEIWPTAVTNALLNDQHPESSLITEGHQAKTNTAWAELERLSVNRLAAEYQAKGLDIRQSPSFINISTVDRSDYPDLSPAQFAKLQKIAGLAVEHIDHAVAERGDNLAKAPSLAIRERGLSYEENPPHLVLAA